MPGYTLEGEEGPVRLADLFGGRSQLIVYRAARNQMSVTWQGRPGPARS
jgi:predicted dithiol-disulfide oxidoreductase (DUF899 family)